MKPYLSHDFVLLPERIFIANRRWVEGKALRVTNGWIVSIAKPSRLDRKLRIMELPGIALLPGLVNSHSHLEYTDPSFKKPLRPSFVDWLEAIRSWKLERSPGDVQRSLKRGVKELLKSGVTAVGDHYCGREIPWELIQSPLRGVAYHEVLGLNPANAGPVLVRAKKYRKRFPKASIRFGLALHAPYTLSDTLVQKAMAWVKANNFSLSMHVGESRDEGELFQNTDSALGRWLKKVSGISVASEQSDVFGHLERLGLWSVCLQAVHMNLARKQHLRWFRPKRMTVVYCPKSHEYFRHPRFDLEMFLGRGFRVALGTDSLASNNTLDMWEELRLAKKLHPGIPLETLWDMATANGAMSLGLHDAGQIRPGYKADLIGIAATRTRHPLEEVLRHKGDVVFRTTDENVTSGILNC